MLFVLGLAGQILGSWVEPVFRVKSLLLVLVNTRWTLTFLWLAGDALADGFPLSLPPHDALLLLQPLLLRVAFVPAAFLHQALVGPAAAVGGRYAFLVFI